MNQSNALPHLHLRLALTAVVVLVLALCYLIAEPFIPALVWAVTLAVMFAPLERMLRTKLRFPSLSVAIAMIFAGVMVVAPTIFVSAALIDSIVESADLLERFLSAGNWAGLAREYPGAAPALVWVDNYVDLPELLQSLIARLEGWGTSLILGSLTSLINLLLTFYFLFYMLRDRTRILAKIGQISPFSDGDFRVLVDRIVQTIFASVYGTAAVSALQGFLGGLIFWWLDLPSPVFWGVIMGLLGIVPFLGAFVVWVPVSIALALDGDWLSAAILVIWGTLIVGLIDNIIYPILVGRRLAIHSMVTFVAIVGGFIVFGGYGFVLGPVIVSIALCLLDMLRRALNGADQTALAQPQNAEP